MTETTHAGGCVKTGAYMDGARIIIIQLMTNANAILVGLETVVTSQNAVMGKDVNTENVCASSGMTEAAKEEDVVATTIVDAWNGGAPVTKAGRALVVTSQNLVEYVHRTATVTVTVQDLKEASGAHAFLIGTEHAATTLCATPQVAQGAV